MFFVMSKILDFLLSPLIWIIILFLLGMVLYRRKSAKKLLIASLSMFLFFTNSFISDEFIRMTEQPMIRLDTSDHYDCGIVLGGGMVTIDRPMDRLIFQDNTDRMLQAVELYKKGNIRKILLSSGSGSLIFKDMYEGALIRRFLLDTGIPDRDILVDSCSRNTYENAVNSVKLLNDSLPSGRYLLITSALHMKRAQACFRAQKCETTAYPVSKITGDRRWEAAYLLIPETENLRQWERLLHEWFGYLTYKIKGYL